MKSQETKRKEAEDRAKGSTWEDSKAKRLGTMTEAEWNERRKPVDS